MGCGGSNRAHRRVVKFGFDSKGLRSTHIP